MLYLLLKFLHISFAVISISSFVVRGIWMIQQSPHLQQRWVKIIPHINDSLLLITALIMLALNWGNPLNYGWLTAKISGLFIYIILGMWAFRFAKTRPQKIAAWLLAVITFGYIVAVAISKQPLII